MVLECVPNFSAIKLCCVLCDQKQDIGLMFVLIYFKQKRTRYLNKALKNV